MRRMMMWVLCIMATFAVVGASTFWYSPALLVDTIDRFVSRITSNQDIVKLADSVTFGPRLDVKLDIWSTNQQQSKTKPVLVFFYGGGWANGTRTEYSYAARPFIEAGYIVVLPDYRKVPGVRFPAFVEDSAEAVKWVQNNIARYGGDPNRISVAGHSAGAYNALMLALDPQWLGDRPIQAAISMAGPTDFYPFTSKRSIDAMSQAVNPKATQPISFVRKDAAPILLLHGTADSVVRVRNAHSLYTKQKAAGGRISMLIYDGASHDDLVLSLSTLFRGRLPVVENSLSFLKGAQARSLSVSLADPKFQPEPLPIP